MKLAQTVSLLFLVGCGGRPLIAGVPLCDSADIILCAPNQTRDGMQCASCTNPDDTLTCQSPDHEMVLCVSDCGSCDHDQPAQKVDSPVQLATVGVHLCGYDDSGLSSARRRDNKWCAICATEDLSATMQLCTTAQSTNVLGTSDTTTICDDVVCVRDCSACPIY